MATTGREVAVGVAVLACIVRRKKRCVGCLLAGNVWSGMEEGRVLSSWSQMND